MHIYMIVGILHIQFSGIFVDIFAKLFIMFDQIGKRIVTVNIQRTTVDRHLSTFLDQFASSRR